MDAKQRLYHWTLSSPLQNLIFLGAAGIPGWPPAGHAHDANFELPIPLSLPPVLGLQVCAWKMSEVFSNSCTKNLDESYLHFHANVSEISPHSRREKMRIPGGSVGQNEFHFFPFWLVPKGTLKLTQMLKSPQDIGYIKHKEEKQHKPVLTRNEWIILLFRQCGLQVNQEPCSLSLCRCARVRVCEWVCMQVHMPVHVCGDQGFSSSGVVHLLFPTDLETSLASQQAPGICLLLSVGITSLLHAQFLRGCLNLARMLA